MVVSESWTGRKGEPPEGIEAASEEVDSAGRVGEAKRVSYHDCEFQGGREQYQFCLGTVCPGSGTVSGSQECSLNICDMNE